VWMATSLPFVGAPSPGTYTLPFHPGIWGPRAGGFSCGGGGGGGGGVWLFEGLPHNRQFTISVEG
jgi:hypothetical protein